MIDGLERLAQELVERQRTAHERVACPKCGQPVGQRCRDLRRKRYALVRLEHPHAERIRADGLPLR